MDERVLHAQVCSRTLYHVNPDEILQFKNGERVVVIAESDYEFLKSIGGDFWNPIRETVLRETSADTVSVDVTVHVKHGDEEVSRVVLSRKMIEWVGLPRRTGR